VAKWRDLESATRLLALHLTEAVRRLGAGALDVIDLPPLTGGAIEPGQLRAVAALFWAMEVDEAGVIDVADALAEGLRVGRVAIDPGRAAPLLFDWHRQRERRLTADERHAIYERLFGSDDVRGQLDQLIALLAAVYTLEGPTPHLLAEISVAAEQLATSLSARSAGITAFAAREIVETIRSALAILESRDVLAAFGQRSVEGLLVSQGPALVGRALDPMTCFDRARAGQQILSWLADVGASVEGGRVTVTPADAVVHAATGWQALGPSRAGARPAPSAPAAPPQGAVTGAQT
jgi:hypothetical protein